MIQPTYTLVLDRVLRDSIARLLAVPEPLTRAQRTNLQGMVEEFARREGLTPDYLAIDRSWSLDQWRGMRHCDELRPWFAACDKYRAQRPEHPADLTRYLLQRAWLAPVTTPETVIVQTGVPDPALALIPARAIPFKRD